MNDYIDVEASSGTVYADMGLPNAEEMLVKAQLAQKIGEIMKSRRLTQVAAAELFGMSQPKLSGLLRGQFRGISEAKMLDCLSRLGRDVQIVVAKSKKTTGTIKVVFA
jgi:predicted XRE-type DNA-binding protein